MTTLRAGDTYGRYRILQDELAQGLCGPVYHAEITKDDGTHEQVALKILTNKQSQVRLYFLNEELLLKRGKHPHLVRYVHSNLRDEPYNLATAFSDTINHKEALAPLKNPMLALRITEHISSALDYLHTMHPNAPVIHRDVKPDNILVDKNTNQAILVDLSVATHPGFSVVDERGFGSPPYMAPEQYSGHEVKASDQFALAFVTYYFLRGKPMIEIKPPKSKDVKGMDSSDAVVYGTALETWYAQAQPLFAKQHLHLRDTLGSQYPNTADVLVKASAFRPEARYPSCAAFAQALGQALQSDGAALNQPVALPNTARKPWRSIVGIGAMVALAVALLFFLWSSDAKGNEPGAISTVVTGTGPTITLPPAPTSPPTIGGLMPTTTLAPFPTITLAPLGTPVSTLQPTITLPPFVTMTGPPDVGRIVQITVRRTILRAVPGDGAANVLRSQVLAVGDQFEITDATAQKVKGDRRNWYRVRRLTDKVEGWIPDESFN